MAATWDDAPEREETWFTTDPPLNFPACPPLLASAGGKFDFVQARARKAEERRRYVVIMRLRTIIRRESMGYRKVWVHFFRVHVCWPVSTATGNFETDQRNFAAGVADVLTRIQGPQGDKTHGGLFASAGEIPAQFGPSDIRVDESDPEKQTDPLEATISYQAYDSFNA